MGFILIEKMDYTIYEYIEKFHDKYEENEYKLKKMFTELANIMIDNEFIHSDLTYDNIMINVDIKNNPIKMRLIDWTFLQKYKDPKENWSIGKFSITYFDY